MSEKPVTMIHCPVCLEDKPLGPTFRHAKMLSCGHGICKPCLVSILETQWKENIGYIPSDCPVCRKVIPLEELTDVYGTPGDFGKDDDDKYIQRPVQFLADMATLRDYRTRSNGSVEFSFDGTSVFFYFHKAVSDLEFSIVSEQKIDNLEFARKLVKYNSSSLQARGGREVFDIMDDDRLFYRCRLNDASIKAPMVDSYVQEKIKEMKEILRRLTN